MPAAVLSTVALWFLWVFVKAGVITMEAAFFLGFFVVVLALVGGRKA